MPVSLILESRTNPRKTFDPAAMAELTASVKEHGVLQSLLVRPLPADLAAPSENLAATWPQYELVAGERRLRAARAAGLAHVPVMVRALSDQQVLEIQVIENLQREDLSAIEEAEGYAALVKSGLTVDQVVERVGKKRSRVYDYLRLVKLDAKTRQALEEGKITPSVATLLAQIPEPKARAEMLRFAAPDHEDYTPSVRQVREEIERACYRSLAGVPFTLERVWDAEHPACTSCPHRSGNLADRDPATKPNLCLKPSCRDWKMKAVADEALRAAESQDNVQVLKGKEAKDLFWSGGTLRSQAHVDLDKPAHVYDRTGPTWKQVLNKQKVEVAQIVAVDGDGKVHTLATRASLRNLVKAGKLKSTEAIQTALGIPSEDRAVAAVEDKRQREMNKLVMDYMAETLRQAAEEAFAKPEKLAGVLRVLALSSITVWSQTAERCGWKDERALEAAIMTLSPAQVLGALVEAHVVEADYEDALLKLCGKAPSVVRANAKKAAEGILAAQAKPPPAPAAAPLEKPIKPKPAKTPALAKPEKSKPAKAPKAAAKTKRGK